MEAHHCLRAKLSCFAFCRTVEALVHASYFTRRPINLYFTYFSVFLPCARNESVLAFRAPQARSDIAVWGRYTIGTNRSRGQVVPSECSTQFQEARWAHMRSLHHRGNRGGGVLDDPSMKGHAFCLECVANDQCHLVFVPEYGLHADNHAQHGQSGVTKAEKRAEDEGRIAAFNLNSHIPAWVIEQPGVKEDWEKFEARFLTEFTAGQQYIVDGAEPGIVGRTAEQEAHRTGVVSNVLGNLHSMPRLRAASRRRSARACGC